ncbi:hypothetical protein I547_4643 [Mycobacterium kansasii 824]|uniref:Uncharacterized protein n=1 Tax=Mycobacterium kansasii TaxID=1768 RepID=A0A1V3WZX9_MYCKA|nr:hypothetical protein I547_4643 [Mycobacterium kansasii 824]OOK68184.1 hypothetical protein BZL29_6916 [Mycobacterium kansasii]OOK72437.1 hypothetical protein BZL30_5549 [Mycobacterium kansasii]
MIGGEARILRAGHRALDVHAANVRNMTPMAASGLLPKLRQQHVGAHVAC